MKRNFLIVAANGQQREELAGELRGRGFTVTRAASGKEAERVVRSVSFDVVLIESHLSDTGAAALRDQLRKVRPDCRVVVLTSFDQLRNSPRQLEFGQGHYLLDAREIYDLLGERHEPTQPDSKPSFEQRGNQALTETIDVLVGLLELDDRCFGGSSHKAMRLAGALAERLTSETEAVEEIVLASLLRDVGKVAVDPEVLTSEGPYSEDQKAQMRSHVAASVRLFEHVDFPWKILPIIRHHHERYDGTGYPDGLRGREIPLGARIVAVVDAFMALTSRREHRAATDADSAINELIRHAGRQFDPEVVEAFQDVLHQALVRHPSDRNARVLIADRQKDFRRLLKMRLLNEGLDADDMETGEAVVGRLLKDPPDLLLVDVDGDGAETFRLLNEIRADDTLCRLPVALIAGRADRLLKIRALREGIDDYFSKVDDLEEIVARVRNILTRETIRCSGGSRRSRRGITGDLENLSLPDIVQTLSMGMKTARVTLSSNGDRGRIWFENGAARHAKFGSEEGEPAFCTMVGWSEGEFVIEHGIRSKATTIRQDTMYLLMEGLRQLDEAQRDATQAHQAQ